MPPVIYLAAKSKIFNGSIHLFRFKKILKNAVVVAIFLGMLGVFGEKPIFAFTTKALDTEIAELEERLNQLPIRRPGKKQGNRGYFTFQTLEDESNPTITFDLKQPTKIDAIAMVPSRIPDGQGIYRPTGFPRRFAIWGSNEPDFNESTLLVDERSADFPDPLGFPVVFSMARSSNKFRYIQFVATQLTRYPERRSLAFGMEEFYIYANGQNVCIDKPATSSRSFEVPGEFSLKYINDGITSLGQPTSHKTFKKNMGWHSSIGKNTNRKEYFELNFGALVEIEELRLYPVMHPVWNYVSAYGFPIHFKIDAFVEGKEWKTLIDYTEYPFPYPGNNVVYFSGLAVSAQRIRMIATVLPMSIPNQSMFALGEFEVISSGKNIAQSAKIMTSSDHKDTFRWRKRGLVDNRLFQGGIIPSLDWLMLLKERGDTENTLRALRAERKERLNAYVATIWGVVVLMAILVVFSLFLVVRNRKLRKRQIRRLQTEIASDLHDEIGSNLACIAMLSSPSAQSKNSPDKDALDEISDIAKDTAQSIKDIVWMLYPERKFLVNLRPKLKEITHRLLLDIPHEFVVGEYETRAPLPLAEVRHLLFFFKEALHNLTRHSRAQFVKIELTKNRHHFELIIEDSGISLDPDKLPISLVDRASKMCAQLEYIPSPDGNRLHLKIPIRS